MARVLAVLFDVDGTLLDTKEVWIAAFEAGTKAVGRKTVPGSVAAQWIGTPIETIYQRAGLLPDEIPKAIQVFIHVEAESIDERIRPYPRVPEAVAALGAWKLAAVTNKARDTTVAALRLTKMLPYFPVILGGDSVPRKKPAPDPIFMAAEALGVRPAECVVVGDTENDVQAAKGAGARSIGVLWGYGTRERLEAAGVDHLIETPDALPPLLRALTPSRAA